MTQKLKPWECRGGHTRASEEHSCPNPAPRTPRDTGLKTCSLPLSAKIKVIANIYTEKRKKDTHRRLLIIAQKDANSRLGTFKNFMKIETRQKTSYFGSCVSTAKLVMKFDQEYRKRMYTGIVVLKGKSANSIKAYISMTHLIPLLRKF